MEEARDLICEGGEGEIVLEEPMEKFTEAFKGAVTFRCMEGKVPMQEEVQDLFWKLWDRLELISCGVRFGAVELLFEAREEAGWDAALTMERERSGCCSGATGK